MFMTGINTDIFRKLRKRDASKFHIQLCFSILGVLLVLLIGVDRKEVFGVCVTASVLLHYFTLASVMWMGAEALLMFQKLVIVFVQITTKYIVILSLVCWCKYYMSWFYNVTFNVMVSVYFINCSVTNCSDNHSAWHQPRVLCHIPDPRG